MKKIMAVYDEDPFYAERLSDYINRREDGIFSARAFTSRKRLEEFARDHGIDVLLTGTLSEGGFPGLPSVQRILLTEEEVRTGACFWPGRKSCCSLHWIRLPVFPAFWTSSGGGIFRI